MAAVPSEHATSGDGASEEPSPYTPPKRSFRAGEFNEFVRGAGPPTRDDQSVTRDGRVLDTKEKVIQFFAEIELIIAEERRAEGTVARRKGVRCA